VGRHGAQARQDACTARAAVAGKIGIDLGLSHFAILSSGEKIAAPNVFRKNEARLATLSRRLAKKQKGSANRQKAKLKLARRHAKTAVSSKRCSDCGHTVAKMALNIRAWTCPECGSLHDRDINAARNVLAAGLAVSAHGESVSPMSL
jgi:transposase